MPLLTNESVAFSYNGSNTITATITNATIGEDYYMWSDFTFPGVTGNAASSTLVLTLATIAEGAYSAYAVAGWGLDAFVKLGATAGSNDPYIGTSRFCWGSTGECCFDATWDFNGIDLICVTFTLPDTGNDDYFLQVFDQSTSGSSVIGFRATGTLETICVRAVDNVTHTTFTNGTNALNSATINVDYTTGFDASGTIWILGKPVTYTGKTAFSFTGCGNHAAYSGAILASQSNPATANGVNAVNSATLNVDATAGYSASGTLEMLGVLFTYTGKTGTSFTGCGPHPATTGGEDVNLPYLGGIVAQLSNGTDFETYATRLFTQAEAGAGYPGQPPCLIPVSFDKVVFPQ